MTAPVPRSVTIARAVHRALIVLVSRDVRHAYRNEMIATFEAASLDAGRRGPAAVGVLLVREIKDLAMSRRANRPAGLTLPAEADGGTSVSTPRREWPQTSAWRQAWRSLRRRPAYLAAAVLTLGFGAGVTTAVFSLVDTVLLKPLPFPDGDRLVIVYESSPSAREKTSLIAPGRLEDWHRLNRSFVALSGSYSDNVTDTSGAEPERLEGRRVAPRFFAVYGMPPLAGRWFTNEEEWENGPRAVMISDRLWARRFERDPAAVGRPLIIGGRSYPIVGVMPGTFTSAATDVWLPSQTNAWLLRQRDARFMGGVGRLRAGCQRGSGRARAGHDPGGIRQGVPQDRRRLVCGGTLVQREPHRQLAARAPAGLRRGCVPVDHRGRQHRRADARPAASACPRARDPRRPWRLARTRDGHGDARSVSHRGARRRARRRSGRLAGLAHAHAAVNHAAHQRADARLASAGLRGRHEPAGRVCLQRSVRAGGFASATQLGDRRRQPRRRRRAAPPAAAPRRRPGGTQRVAGRIGDVAPSQLLQPHAGRYRHRYVEHGHLPCWSGVGRGSLACRPAPGAAHRAPRAIAPRPGRRPDQLPARNRRDAALPGLRRGPDGTERRWLHDRRHTHDQRRLPSRHPGITRRRRVVSRPEDGLQGPGHGDREPAFHRGPCTQPEISSDDRSG